MGRVGTRTITSAHVVDSAYVVAQYSVHIAGGQTTVILHLGAYGSAYFSATCVPRRCDSARTEARRGVKSFRRRSCVWLSTRAKRVPVPGEEREGWRLRDLELGYSAPSACHIGPLINDKLSLCLYPIIKAFKAGLYDMKDVNIKISGTYVLAALVVEFQAVCA